MNFRQPYIKPNGRRFQNAIQALQQQNTILAQGILDHLNWQGDPEKFLHLLKPANEEQMTSVAYFHELQEENQRLRTSFNDLIGADKADKTLATLIPPGQENYIAPYNEQLKRNHGRGVSVTRVPLGPHHLMEKWKAITYQKDGKLKGPHKYRPNCAPSVLTDLELHRLIHRVHTELRLHPWDALKDDLDRFEDVHDVARTPSTIVSHVVRTLEAMHADRYGIEKPKGKREERIAMRIGGDRPDIAGRR